MGYCSSYGEMRGKFGGRDKDTQHKGAQRSTKASTKESTKGTTHHARQTPGRRRLDAESLSEGRLRRRVEVDEADGVVAEALRKRLEIRTLRELVARRLYERDAADALAAVEAGAVLRGRGTGAARDREQRQRSISAASAQR